ncbi:aminotransferase class I/II-fold pyridoxal phosphate-dependent enzyme [Actinocrispum sp. NPDC049592]|uniref:MalY/PatB family protein n=1 Tax=Actinocrispum sp. NPDC049592 TaxID=3154835 RepID=UPI0034124A0E
MSPFDRVDPDRLRSGFGVKWGSLPPDTLGAWVADMDFGIPPVVRDRMLEVIERGDLGYPFWTGEDPVVTAFQDRMATRFGWAPTEGRTRVFTDLIQILQVMIETTTEPGDGVAIHVPTYPPFLASIVRAGRRVVPIPMVDTGSRWGFDTSGLRDCRLLVLVNPHNPTGRVFTRAELEALAGAGDMVVLTDEIHADLTYPSFVHTPFASLGPDVARRTVTATSATKAFNLAAMRCAVAHIGPDHLKAKLDAAPLDIFGQPSILGRVATVAAWREGDAWLAGLLNQLTGNRRMVTEWASGSFHPPEATYLAWLRLGVDAGTVERRAKVKLSPGAEFSAPTEVNTQDFVRLNLATSPDILREILDRLQECLEWADTSDLVTK